MNPEIVERAAETALDSINPEAIPALIEAIRPLASKLGLMSSDQADLAVTQILQDTIPRSGTATSISSTESGSVANLSSSIEASPELPAIDMRDPRTYANKFVGMKRSSSAPTEAELLAAIVRNSESGEPSKFVTPGDVRAQFGPSKPGRSVEDLSEYLEKSTGFRLSPQAVRFRSHDALDGHYAMLVKGSESTERIAYGQVSGRDRLIFETGKGKEFSWKQLNQFGRRVIAAHRLDRLGEVVEDSANTVRTPEEEALIADRNARLINPPDEKGGFTRVNNVECVSAVLRNKLFCDLKPFENVLDVQSLFGNSSIARRLSPDQARLFGKSYLEMSTGAKLEEVLPFHQDEVAPGHYALFFDTQSKLPQVAYGNVAEDGTRYIYYPRTDKQLPLSSMHDSNLATFRVVPGAQTPPTAAAETSAHLSAEQLASGIHTQDIAEGTNIDFAGNVTHLLRFRSGKSNSVLQNFILQSEEGKELRIVHSVLNSRLVPLQVGDAVSVRGQYALNHAGQGILHWTHKSGPDSGGIYGWVQHNGKRYW